MYGCESCTIKKAKRQRIDAFELWCWRRLLRVPWTARRSNQSILKEINPGCSLKGLMLKLKLQYFGHLMWRTDSFEKTLNWERLRAGGEGDDRMKWLDGITDTMDMYLCGFRESVMDREAWHAVVHGVTKSWTWLSDWTELNDIIYQFVTFQLLIHLISSLWKGSASLYLFSVSDDSFHFVTGGCSSEERSFLSELSSPLTGS